jgi:hypothetical protein
MQNNPSPKKEHFTGHVVVDNHNHVLGQVSDVIYDDSSNEPTWMVVKPGFLRAEHYAPVEGSYVAQDGRIIVSFDKHWLKTAPKAEGRHVLDRATIRQLEDHYDISSN